MSEIKCILKGEESYSNIKITFFKDTYNQEVFDKHLANLKNSTSTKKIILVDENGNEEVLLER